MRPVLNRVQSRHFDRYAIETCRVPSLLLMDAAGRGAADWLIEHEPVRAGIQVVCGPGNNGGDGWVVARRLLIAGLDVHAISSVSPSSLAGDAEQMFAAYAGSGGTWSQFQDAEQLRLLLQRSQLIVDALFGTGLQRSLEGAHAEIVGAINAASAAKVALDLPSGLDADTGAVHGVCVQADATVTFGHPKLGLLTPNGVALGGQLAVVDIGVPPAACQGVGHSAVCLEVADVDAWLSAIPDPNHKGQAGRVLVVAGSPGILGAARLVAHAAFRAGAGLVTLGARPECVAGFEADLWEVMVKSLQPGAAAQSLGAALVSADCLAIGPGLGLDAAAREVVHELVLNHPGKIVVDADALTLFAGEAAKLAQARGRLMLTPHPGEAARLLGVTARDVEADRFTAVKQLAALTQATVLLKGVRTLICAPGGLPMVNPRGASLLATAGSGDVLTGVVAALACHLEGPEALATGAWLHGLAGEQLARAGQRRALAREIADQIGHLRRHGSSAA
jgi:ADP-dependent NAD(P)H-hydrate dehydratase / NAD(P)H-hydrate epimerase